MSNLFLRFGEGKEEAMIFLNEFVESQTPKLKKFIEEISVSSHSSHIWCFILVLLNSYFLIMFIFIKHNNYFYLYRISVGL